MPVYDKAEFAEVAHLYRTGQKRLNVTATSTTMAVIVKTLRDIIEQLNTIISKERLVPFSLIRKFILSQLHFQMAEVQLFAAFAAPEDELFYQSEDSDDWRIINDHLEVNEV